MFIKKTLLILYCIPLLAIPLVMHSCISPLGPRNKKPPVPLCTDYSIKRSKNTFTLTRG